MKFTKGQAKQMQMIREGAILRRMALSDGFHLVTFNNEYHNVKKDFVGELLKAGLIEWFAWDRLKYRHGSEAPSTDVEVVDKEVGS